MTKTWANLRDRMSQKIDDYLHSTVTTSISNSALLVDTSLPNEEGGNTDDAYNNWRILVTSLENIGENRIINDYVVSDTSISLAGGNLTTDGVSLASYEIHRYNPDDYLWSINESSRQLYPVLFKPLRDRTIVTGNWFTNGSFEDWVSANALEKWTTESATVSQESTAGSVRSGTYSAKVYASAANGSLKLRAREHPPLADLAGKTVTFRGMAKPSVSDGAQLNIYYVDASGDGQSNATTTADNTSVADQWNLIEYEDFAIPDGATDIYFGLVTSTSGANVIWDDVRVVGPEIYEYKLPNSFEEGKLLKVSRQESGNADHACDDIRGNRYLPCPGYDIKYDGADKYLQFYKGLPSEYRLELEGYGPLEDNITGDASTMTIEDPYTELLTTHAVMLMFEKLGMGAPWDSSNYYYSEYIKWRDKMLRLKRTHRMTKPNVQFNRSL